MVSTISFYPDTSKIRYFLAYFYLVFLHYETENEKIATAEKNFGETEAAKTILFAEFHEEIEALLKKISSLDSQISILDFQTLENKIDAFEWKVDSSSDPSLKESNDDLPETENEHIETEPLREREGVKVNNIDSIVLYVTCLSIVSVYGSLNRPSYLPQSECPELNEPVDAVYTWVNGSDPEFLRSLEETDLGLETHSLDTSPQRYQGLLHGLSFFIL